ncbi:hypothetical protein [Aurantiacibacter aquimixticola]|uniref:Uncharacterized protein n=1 Tax=Aurantiacibacter aquimixticola TaxID=1958945 RepID=A0A419RX10_9SPHN|nr:hypothetical protein [Aurantiacibacter aquimixticola]RJY10291.1 hypothetical protein D6201_08285 [Aurantiacibacter aquimixticola]
MRNLPVAIAALALPLTSCTTTPEPLTLVPEQQAFWDALSSHCGPNGEGRAYAGTLVSEDARDADWAGKAMVAHWAECSSERIAIAFHVEDEPIPPSSSEAVGRQASWNRSRTWLVSKEWQTDGHIGGETYELRLDHDHRHEDGERDAVTGYGGIATSKGTARGQDFPVHADALAVFAREGLDASTTNVWRMEVDPASDPNARFAYQLTRENDPTRLFRVEFDASTPVAPPPPAWGW